MIHFGVSRESLKNHRGSVHIGDAPVYELKNWLQRGSFPKEIQLQMRRAVKQGVTVSHLALPPTDMNPLRECLSGWLRGKGLPPLGFATNPFLLEPWPEHGIFVAEREDRICGFLVFSLSSFQNMPQIDLIVRALDAPNGCAEILVATVFQSLAVRGFEKATLGLAPLSRRTALAHRESPAWFRFLSGCSRRLASPWYSFAGLETFKAKFKPDFWEPMYAVSQGRSFTPRDLLAVLRAFAGGSLVRYAGRSLLWNIGIRPGV